MIEEANFLLAIVTEDSVDSAWVNQEIGFSIGAGTEVLPIKHETPTGLEGLIQSYRYSSFDDESWFNAIDDIISLCFQELDLTDVRIRCPSCDEINLLETTFHERESIAKEDMHYVLNCEGCGEELQVEPRVFVPRLAD